MLISPPPEADSQSAASRRLVRDAPHKPSDVRTMLRRQAAADGEKAVFDAAMRALDDDIASCGGAPDP